MIIEQPSNGSNSAIITEPFAARVFGKQIQPLGNCATYLGSWSGKIESYRALHFLWEMPFQLSFAGAELNWALLPIIANHISAIRPNVTIEIVDLQIVVHLPHDNGNVQQQFGILTCDVSSKIVGGATVGHIALNASPPPKFVSGISLVDIDPKFDERNAVTWMQVGVQGFYTLTNKWFYHSRQ